MLVGNFWDVIKFYFQEYPTVKLHSKKFTVGVFVGGEIGTCAPLKIIWTNNNCDSQIILAYLISKSYKFL